jgi:hypothetical protein
MKNFYPAIFLNKVWIVALVVAMAACSQLEVSDPDKATLEQSAEEMAAAFSLDPYGLENARTAGPIYLDGANNGGNVLCSEAATYFNVSGGFEYTSPDPEGTGGNKYLGGNTFEGSFPDGFTITVIDNKFVSWSFEPVYIDGKKYCLKDLVVLVKGGPGANAYFYNEGQTSDSGLISPPVGQGNTPDLSNLKLCYNLEPCDDEPCFDFVWKGETAWAAGSRYNTTRGGNWATYTTRAALKDGNVTLFAGQTMPAGVVNSTGSGDGIEITITLNDGWRFKAGNESVKIQDYETAPSGNPSPGGFAWKNAVIVGNTATITVPINEFYGIHVDVERRTNEQIEVECPV